MKFIFKLGFAFAFILTACSTAASNLPPPGDVVAVFLDHIQVGEYIQAQELLYDDSILPLHEIEDEFHGIFTNISYDIISEEIGENSADVTLRINSVDFSAVMEDIMSEAFNWIFEDITTAQLSDRIETLLIQKMESDTAPQIQSDVVVTLLADDGAWRIAADQDFANALTGGLFSFAEYAGQWLPN